MRVFPNVLVTLTTLMLLAFLFMPAVGTNIYTPAEMLTNWLSSIAFSAVLLWIAYRIYRDDLVIIVASLVLLCIMFVTTLSDPDDNGSYILWLVLIAIGVFYLALLSYFRYHKVYRHLLRHKRASPLLRAQRTGLLLSRSIRLLLFFMAKAVAAMMLYFVLVSVVILAIVKLIEIEDFPLLILPIFWFFSLLITRGKPIRPILRWYYDTLQRIAPSANELSKLDSRPTVLFLRSFKNDEIFVKGRFRPLLFFFDGKRGEQERLEEVLANEIYSFGPVIAVANPAVTLPPLGAARENLSDDHWQQYIKTHVGQSGLILCLLGDTEHFGWEIDQIQQQNQAEKSLLVIPPIAPDTGLVENLRRLYRADFSHSTELLTDGLPVNTRILVHTSEHQGFIAICSKQKTGLAYVEAVRLALGLRSN